MTRSRREERELAEFRRETVYVGIQTALTRYGFELLELRNERQGSTRAHPVAKVVRHVDGLTCDCLGCGREYPEEDGLLLDWSGRYLAGGCWCSESCRERWAIEAETHCGCGAKPTHLGPNGGTCLACLRHDVRAELQRLALVDDSDAVQAFAAQTGLLPATTFGDDVAAGSIVAA